LSLFKSSDLYVKITALFSLAGLIGVSFLGWIFYKSEINHLKVNIQKELLTIVRTGALQINGDLHELLHAESKGVPNLLDEFEEIRTQLMLIKKNNKLEGPGSPLYTMRPIELNSKALFEFVVMVEKNDAGKWFIGYTVNSRDHLEKTIKGEAQFTDLYDDEEGSWISAAAPIKNQSNEVVALLQADRHVDYLEELALQKTIQVAISVLFGYLLIIGIGAYGTFKMLVPLRAIISHIGVLEKGGLNRAMRISSGDEFEEVSKAFNHLMKVLSKTLIDMDLIENLLDTLNIGVWVLESEDKVTRANKFALDLQESKDLKAPNIDWNKKPFMELQVNSSKSIAVVATRIQWRKQQSLITVIDVRELKITQEKLEEAVKEAQEANKALKLSQQQMLQQEKMASIGQLSSGLAHEINNPVGYISSNLELIKDIVYDKEVCDENYYKFSEEDVIDLKEMLEDCLHGVKKVFEIVQNMKTFTQMGDDDSFVLSSITPCISVALKMLNKEIRSDIWVEFDEKKEFLAEIQPRRLSQAFLYILLNSIQSIKENGEIKIIIKEEKEQLIITIEDNGIGIPKEVQSRIFEPFFTTKDVDQGKGLGLSNAYDLIKSHHGDIKVLSEEGRGTTIKIILPKSVPIT